MHFTNPQMLWLLWLLLPLALLLRVAASRKQAALHRFAEPELLDRLRRSTSYGRIALRQLLLMSGLLGIVLALAGPRWGFQWEDVRRRGVDLVVALDLSRSMLAEDAKPDRLTAAKREIADLLDLLQGDRVGLVAFAGTAFVQCPLTLDYRAFELFLDVMDPSWVPVGGTDLAAAVRTSMQAFPQNERSGRAVLLITDGEDHSGQLRQAAEEARKAGVHVFVVGMGDPQGAPIPDGRGGFVKEGGKVVLSKLDEAGLKELALTTEGTFVRSVAGDLDLRTIYLDDIKGALEARELSSSRQRRWEERFQWMLLPALLLLVLEGLTGPGRARAPRGVGAAVGLLAGVLLVAVPSPAHAWSLFGPPAPARAGLEAFERGEFEEALSRWTEAQTADPADRRLDYNLGQALYRLERFPEAEQAFLAATATDVTQLAADAFHGAGNAAFQQGRYPDAIAHFEAALALRPEDADAEHNRDLAQRRYEELMEQAEQQPEQPPPDEQQDEDSQAENEEKEEGEEGEGGEEQQQQEQQQGKSGEQKEEDAASESDGEKQDDQEPKDEGQGQQEQQQQEQQEQAGGAAEAADVDRDPQEAADSTPEGAVSSNTEEAAGDERPASVVEGALTPEQAEELLKALKADERNRQKQRTEREARRGREAAGKDW